MKLRFLYVLFILALAGCTTERADVVGEWVGTDAAGEKLAFVFEKDGSVIVKNGDTVIGGKETRPGEKRVTTRYVFDHTRSPAWFDVIYSMDGQEKLRILSIVKFTGRDRMLLKGNDPNTRPMRFDNGRDEVLFIKTR